MTNTDIILTEKVVCFIDILGFKNLIKRLASEEKKIKQIFDALTSISEQSSRSTYIPDQLLPNGEQSTKELPLSYTHFSDSLLISMELPQDDLEIQISLRALFWRIYLISKELFDKGVLLRGAISIGKIFHGDKVVFGQALVDAYNLSEKIAVYPKIIVDDLIVEKFPKCSSYQQGDIRAIRRDLDGL